MIADLALRPTTPDDLPNVLRLEQAEESRPFITPWPEEQHRRAITDPDCFRAILQGPDRAGFLILFGRPSPHRCVEFRRLVVDHKGRGVGRTALRLAFEEWQAHRLWLDVKTHNHRAKELYRSEGFHEEGLLRECLKASDQYESLVILAMLESEYQAGKGNGLRCGPVSSNFG